MWNINWIARNIVNSYYKEEGLGTKIVIAIITFLFAEFSWPEENTEIFRSSSQAVTCPPIRHTQWELHTVLLLLNVKQESCDY